MITKKQYMIGNRVLGDEFDLMGLVVSLEAERAALTAEIAIQVGYKNDYKAAYAECVENDHAFRARITQENDNE